LIGHLGVKGVRRLVKMGKRKVEEKRREIRLVRVEVTRTPQLVLDTTFIDVKQWANSTGTKWWKEEDSMGLWTMSSTISHIR